MTSWVFKRRFVLDCHDFSVAQCKEESTALVLGLILVVDRFASVVSVRIGSIRIRVTWVNNRDREDSSIE